MAEMYNKLVEKRTTAPVTIPIRANLGTRSLSQIKQFVDTADNDALFPVTLTIWSAALDLVDTEALETLVLEVGKNRVYVDVPWEYTSPRRSFPAVQSKSKSSSSINNQVISFLQMMF